MSEYHLIQDNGGGGIEIAAGDSLEDIKAKIEAMNGAKA